MPELQAKQKQIFQKSIVIVIMIIASLILILLHEKTSVLDRCFSSYSNNPITKDGFYFDTYVSITVFDSLSNYSEEISGRDDLEALLDECMDICDTHSRIFSRTDEQSELYQLNNNSAFLSGATVSVSDPLADCISKTLEYSTPFGILYSIEAGGLSDLWDFNSATVPNRASILASLISIDSYDFDIDKNNTSLTFNVTNFKTILNAFNYEYSYDIEDIHIDAPSIDLGASAKGYIADKLCKHLMDNGINDAIIDLGGNIVVIGDKYDDSMYKVGIKKPFSKENESYAVCKIADKALVTSGIYERYFEQDGNIYHHIIDCSTGYPADNDILSITIICSNALQADCFSTGCLLLGKDNALTIINNTEEVECIIIDDEYNIYLSDGLKYDDDFIVLK